MKYVLPKPKINVALAFLISLGLLFLPQEAFSQNSQKSSKVKSSRRVDLKKLQLRLDKNPENLKLRQALAVEYKRRKQWKKVIETLKAYTNSVEVPAFLDLALAYQKVDDSFNQVRVLRILNKKDPESAPARLSLGLAIIQLAAKTENMNQALKLEDEAIELIRSSININPKFKLAYEELLKFFEKKKNNYEARELTQELIKQFGPSPRYLNLLCQLYAQDGYLAQAEEACKKAITKSPGFPDNFIYLALVQKSKQKGERAEKTLTSAARRFRKSEFVQRSAGDYFLEQKNYPVAERYFRAAVRSDAKSDLAQIGLGYSLFAQNQREASLAYFKKACRLNNIHSDALLEMASRCRQVRDLKLASQFKSAGQACRLKRKKR